MATGGITQRKGGRWQGSIQVNGTRRTVYGLTKREAQAKLAALQRQADGGLPRPGTRTVNDLLDHFIETARPTRKPRTVAFYEQIARCYVRPTLGPIRLSNLSPDPIQRLYSDLQAQGLTCAPSHVHRFLHRVFHLAVLWRWIGENPCNRVLPPSYQAPRKAIWSPEELRRFLNGVNDDPLYTLWSFLITSGCRLGESLALRWADIDWRAKTVTIRCSLHRIKGEWVESTPKTAAGQRRLALPSGTMEALRRHRAAQTECRLRLGADWQDQGWVFTGGQGQPLHPSTVQHALPRLCERLGLPKLTPHGLRHLSASLLLRQGLEIPAVSARLGHATPAITMSIYAHAMDGADQQAAQALERALGL